MIEVKNVVKTFDGFHALDGATLTVPTGSDPDDTFSFDMDGARGALTEARGELLIDAFGFFQLDGEFVFTSSYGNVTLAELVGHVVVHELAHHFGWSDEDVARIDRWWE